MVTGGRAFPGDSSLSILTAILREEPRPANDLVPGLPAGFNRLIAWCLRKDPQRRIQHMDDVKLALGGFENRMGHGNSDETLGNFQKAPLAGACR